MRSCVTLDQAPRRDKQSGDPGPTQTSSARFHIGRAHQLRARVAEMEVEREEFRKKRGKSLSVPSPDMPGASEQSVALLQRPARAFQPVGTKDQCQGEDRQIQVRIVRCEVR